MKEYREIDTRDYWIEAWNRFAAEPVGSVFSDSGFWDSRAGDYGKKSPESNDRVSRLVDRLTARGTVAEGSRILDIGSGPGTFAIPFVRCGASVVCLDVSSRMIDRIKEVLPEAQTCVAGWKDVDLEKMNWVDHFDLVFAHKTPAINSADDMLKMIRASRDWCFFAGWTGDRRIEPLDGLFLRLVGKRRRSRHFHFALNLLYCSRYYPELGFYSQQRQKRQSFDSAMAYYLDFFSRFCSIPRNRLRNEIASYLRLQYGAGEVVTEHSGTVGEMLWRVETKQKAR